MVTIVLRCPNSIPFLSESNLKPKANSACTQARAEVEGEKGRRTVEHLHVTGDSRVNFDVYIYYKYFEVKMW